MNEEAMTNSMETKRYELRPLDANDMGPIRKIITAIGIRQFKECFKVEDIKDGIDIEELGFGVVFDIAGIIISNLPKAESEIQAFVANVAGLDIASVKKLPFADYGELIVEIVTKEEFRDFFNRVLKLFKR